MICSSFLDRVHPSLNSIIECEKLCWQSLLYYDDTLCYSYTADMHVVLLLMNVALD